MRGLRRASALVAGAFLLFAAGAQAADNERRLGGRVVAREAREHRLVHEFNVGVGVLPLDALYTGVSLGGSYTLHLNDFLALELIDFRYSANLDSGLRRRLNEFSVEPTASPEVEYIAGTGVLYTPFYGKLALFDSAVLRLATHVGANFGVAHFSDGFRFQTTVGPGIRFFFSDTVSSRLDVRGSIAFDEVLSVETLLQINLSVAFNFGRRGSGPVRSANKEADPEAVLDALYPGTKPKPRTETSEEKEDS